MSGNGASAAKVVAHLTRGERAAGGKAARAEVPRSAQAQIDFDTPRDPVALLEEQAVSRVPELVPIRYGRMLVSPFAFYRGGALIMAADLARTPNSGLRVQLCGDAHLSNFGVFGSPERNLVFDINDFDETAPGPWEWDVKRLAASFAIGGRENGFSRKERRSGRARHRARLPGGDERLRCDAQPRRVVFAPVGRAGIRAVQVGRRPEAVEEVRSRYREVAHQGQHARLRQADPARRRRAANRQRSAADRADRRASPHAGGAGCDRWARYAT